jgi:hypothetical protein
MGKHDYELQALDGLVQAARRLATVRGKGGSLGKGAPPYLPPLADLIADLTRWASTIRQDRQRRSVGPEVVDLLIGEHPLEFIPPDPEPDEFVMLIYQSGIVLRVAYYDSLGIAAIAEGDTSGLFDYTVASGTLDAAHRYLTGTMVEPD